MPRTSKGMKKINPKEKLHIALFDLDFSFTQSEIDTAIDMWNKGYDLRVIADELQREGDEVMILLLDLARNKRIEKRENSIWGTRL